MKNLSQNIKKCGDLRVCCGDLKSGTPQDNRLGKITLGCLRVPAGSFLYPMYARTRAHARMGLVGINTPQVHATSLNRPDDNRLACGDLLFEDPARSPHKTPQILPDPLEVHHAKN